MMKRTTILIPDELAALLDFERRRRDVPASALVREALEAYLTGASRASARLPFVGLGRSGHRTTARDIDAILDEEWGGGARSR